MTIINFLITILLTSIFLGCSAKKTRIWIEPPLGTDSEYLRSKDIHYNIENLNSGKKESLVIPVKHSPENLVVQDDRKLSITQDHLDPIATKADKQIQEGKLSSISDSGAPKISYLRVITDIEELYVKKLYSDALVKLLPLIEQYPKQSKLYIMQGTLFKKIGENKLALESYQKAKELEPNNSIIEDSIMKIQNEIGVVL